MTESWVAFVRFCGRASPAQHGPAGKATPDCLPVSISLLNFALLFSQYFISSYKIKSDFRVRLFPQPFFAGLARLAKPDARSTPGQTVWFKKC
jgi:hypothetical protein